jgi:hypothetical protein
MASPTRRIRSPAVLWKKPAALRANRTASAPSRMRNVTPPMRAALPSLSQMQDRTKDRVNRATTDRNNASMMTRASTSFPPLIRSASVQ